MKRYSWCVAIVAILWGCALAWGQAAEGPALAPPSDAAPAASADQPPAPPPAPASEAPEGPASKAGDASEASSSEVPPLVVVSLASYNKILADLGFLGKMIGQPDMRAGMEGMLVMMTDGRGLKGLDSARPWGAVVRPNAMGIPSLLVFIPVSDAKELLTSLTPLLGAAEDVGGGVSEWSANLRQPLYVKPAGAWLFVGMTPEDLKAVPADPLALLGGVNEEYDIAVRLNLSSIPAETREQLIQQLRLGAAMGLHSEPGDTPEQRALRQRVTARSIDQIGSLLNEAEQLTLGCTFEESAVLVDLAVKARPGSAMAAHLNAMGKPETRFAGLRDPDAAARLSVVRPYSQEEIEQTQDNLAQLRTRVLAQLEREPLSHADRQAAKEASEAFLEVLADTVSSGKTADSAFMVNCKDGRCTVLMGAQVADGVKFQDAFDQAMRLLKKDLPTVQHLIRLNVTSVEGIALHQITLPSAAMDLPDDVRSQVVALLGEPVVVIVGIGPESFYVALGEDALAAATEAIQQSAQQGPIACAPLEMVLSLDQVIPLLVAAAGSEESRQQYQAMADLLSQGDQPARIVVSASPVENGSAARIKIDAAVIRAFSLTLGPAGGRGGKGGSVAPGSLEPAAPAAKP